jgi:hypothetical protein
MGEESEQFEEESEFGEGWFGMGGFRDGERNDDTGDNSEDGSADSTMDDSEEEFSSSVVACMALQLRVWSGGSMEDGVRNSLTGSGMKIGKVGVYAHNTRMYARKITVTATGRVITLFTVVLRYGGQ